LVTTDGRIERLHGVSRSGSEYACIHNWGIFEGPTDQASIDAVKSWRVNAVRLPLNEDCWLAINGTPPAYSGTNYQQAIKGFVDLLNQNGLYAILELHWSAPGTNPAMGQQAMPDSDHSPAFWSSVATVFKGNDAVIFELYNEPTPDSNRDTEAAWTCWRDGGVCSGISFDVAGMQTLVEAVRATGATNVIAIGGVQYASSLTRWLAYRPNDPLNNVVAAWHAYNNGVCTTTTCYDQVVGPVGAQVPVIATEIGDNSCSATWLNTLMAWLDGRQMGYAAWVWNTWGPYCYTLALISDYTGTPTMNGEIYKTHLAGLP
jgi:hypothetical protein